MSTLNIAEKKEIDNVCQRNIKLHPLFRSAMVIAGSMKQT